MTKMKQALRRYGVAAIVAAIVGAMAGLWATGTWVTNTPRPTAVLTPATVCGASSLSGPSVAPAGAVVVPAGDNSAITETYNKSANTVYWFAPGIHTLGTGEYSQIQADAGDTFIGAPGAIISGQYENNYAFVEDVPGVTIEYLTIEHFTPPGNQGAVNNSDASGWTIENDTIENNAPGTGVYLGSNDVLTGNCITENGQAGFGAYTVNDASSLTGGPSNVTVTGNEISYNDTCNWEDVSPDPVPSDQIQSPCAALSLSGGCGCADGGKFWRVDGATVTGNYVHNNYYVGLWADTNDVGFD
ncbi:MAG: right-handed parallel beta-helix repeat-containing protein, partial [Terriglobia bacterium]